MFDEEVLKHLEENSTRDGVSLHDVSGEEPSVTYSIAGTWNGWHRIQMRWDGACFVHEVTISKEGYESFQILLNGSWDTVFYPSIQDGSPWAKCKLRGPDRQGHGRNWTIGTPANKRLWRNVAKPGERYLIVVSVDSKRIATGVTWRHADDDIASTSTAAPGTDGSSEAVLDWSPPAPSDNGMQQASRSRCDRGFWLVSEPGGDLELGDIVLLRPGDVVSGNSGLASRGGKVVRMTFVEHSHVEEWRDTALSQLSPVSPLSPAAATAAAAAVAPDSESKAAVGDDTSTAGGSTPAAEEASFTIEVWQVPDVRGWGHMPAIRLKEPTSSLKVRMTRGKHLWQLKEAMRGGLPFNVLIWGSEGQDLNDGTKLEDLPPGRLFYEFYHDVRIYHGGPGNEQRCIQVSVKASGTLYDVRAALVRMYWHKFCDFHFVQEEANGCWTVRNEDDALDGCSEVFAVGAFMRELPAYEVDEEAMVRLWDGPHKGKLAAVRVEGTSDSGSTYDIHFRPTTEYDGLGGFSDTYHPRVPFGVLWKPAKNSEGGHTKPALNKDEALALLQELLDGYRSNDFQSRRDGLLAHYPDRTGYIVDAKYYTGFYTMRKQVLLSLQSHILPKYGFSKHQGGTVMMVATIKQFSGDPEIDRIGKEINSILQPMYEEPLS